MKNKEIITVLNGFAKIEKLKLGGKKLKVILNNKKVLVSAFTAIEVTRKALVEKYKTVGALDGEEQFTPENLEKVNSEWLAIAETDSKVELTMLNSAELDQISDITLEQMEVLMTMAE